MDASNSSPRPARTALIAIVMVGAPLGIALGIVQRSEARFGEQREALARLEAIDRVTHHFDVTRFWASDLTLSAERVSRELVHPTFEALGNTGSQSLADSSWAALNEELDALARTDERDAHFIRENAREMRNQLAQARAAFERGDATSASVANASARSAIAMTHMRLREAEERYAARAREIGEQIENDLSTSRVALAVAGMIAALAILAQAARARGRRRAEAAAKVVPEAALDCEGPPLAAATAALDEHPVDDPAPTVAADARRDEAPRPTIETATEVRAESNTPARTEAAAARLDDATRTLDQLTQLTKELVIESPGRAGGETPAARLRDDLRSHLEGVDQQTHGFIETVRAVDQNFCALRESVDAVSQQSDAATGVARRASELASETDETIGGLGRSASEIGKVVELIRDIAKRTNLLALNATIEAASAGDAGRGFAVVAGEVKELARQTADATRDISENVAAMQATTQGAVDAIANIVSIIEEISKISSDIGRDIEHQRELSSGIQTGMATAIEAADGVHRDLDGLEPWMESTLESARDSQEPESAERIELSLEALRKALGEARDALETADAMATPSLSRDSREAAPPPPASA